MTDYKNELEQIRQQLAAIEHERWADWQKWMHGLMVEHENGKGEWVCLPADRVRAWNRQIETPYSELSDREKASDMEQVDRYWPLIEALLSQHSKKRELEALVWAKDLVLRISNFVSPVQIANEIDDRISQLGGQDETNKGE